jgi:cytochrome c-type biogenesis protein CcmE
MKAAACLLLLAILSALPALAQPQAVTVAALYESKNQYDGQEVTVTGTVGQAVQSGQGSFFMLADSGKAIPVTVAGAGPRDGAQVRVTGIFRKKGSRGPGRPSGPVIEAQKVEPAP